MGKKILAVKFEKQDKKKFKGKVGHTRTGACTSQGKCFHGQRKDSK